MCFFFQQCVLFVVGCFTSFFLGIEGAFSGAGAKTVIPAKVTGKFSIRIVPNMRPDLVDNLVVEHLNRLWQKRGSPNHFK